MQHLYLIVEKDQLKKKDKYLDVLQLRKHRGVIEKKYIFRDIFRYISLFRENIP